MYCQKDDGDVEFISEEVRRWQLDLKLKSLEENIGKLTSELRKEQTKPTTEYDYDEAYNFYVQYGVLPPDFKHFPQCPLSRSELSPLIAMPNTNVHHHHHHEESTDNSAFQFHGSGDSDIHPPSIPEVTPEYGDISGWKYVNPTGVNSDLPHTNCNNPQCCTAERIECGNNVPFVAQSVCGNSRQIEDDFTSHLSSNNTASINNQLQDEVETQDFQNTTGFQDFDYDLNY